MSNSSSNAPKDAVDAVLRQYAGARDKERDQRPVVESTDAFSGPANLTPVSKRQKDVRDELYPNLGSAGTRTTVDNSAADDLQDK
ncbi:hypothetical protein FJZ27_03490 [Candidatus Peribacteria bacterium]|nr:hypothetical protein [Candidatus Peribacteria bacterium]